MATRKRNQKAPFRMKNQAKQPKPLPQDPDRLNDHRARWAAAALAEFRQQTGADLKDAVSDLLADLMHWCDRFGQKFPKELRRALDHYEEETAARSATTALLSNKF